MKTLEPKIYQLDKSYTLQNNGQIKYHAKQDIHLYKQVTDININIQAIVGKNGSGKSTLVELFSMLIANIASYCDILNVDNNIKEELQNLSLEVYFSLDNIYCIKSDKGNIHLSQYTYSEKTQSYQPLQKMHNTRKILKHFFYTIHSNYSLYALNESIEGYQWLGSLFHKNDAYQTPMVIEPYREKGSININTLSSLTEQRLIARILHPFDKSDDSAENSYIQLIDDSYNPRTATHIHVTLNKEKISTIFKTLLNDDSIEDENNFKNAIERFQNDKQYQKVIETLKLRFSDKQYNKNIALAYICYKIQKITTIYEDFFKYKNDITNTDFLEKLLQDKTHITYKLHQAINYIKHNTVTSLNKSSIEQFSQNIEQIQIKHNLPVITLIPPAIFTTSVILNNNILFNTLSSGEKQLIYSITSIIYHLQNLASVHHNNEDKYAYQYINIILDEVELYFHPEFQRKFIYNLLHALKNFSGLENSSILAINFLLITHSPFILSDILPNKILFLDNQNTELKTFGANIHELLASSFFMEHGLMGEYANNIITDIIDFFNKKNNKYKNREKILFQIIQNIGEDFIREKLLQMYESRYPKSMKLDYLLQEQVRIEQEIKRLQNDTTK